MGSPQEVSSCRTLENSYSPVTFIRGRREGLEKIDTIAERVLAACSRLRIEEKKQKNNFNISKPDSKRPSLKTPVFYAPQKKPDLLTAGAVSELKTESMNVFTLSLAGKRLRMNATALCVENRLQKCGEKQIFFFKQKKQEKEIPALAYTEKNVSSSVERLEPSVKPASLFQDIEKLSVERESRHNFVALNSGEEGFNRDSFKRYFSKWFEVEGIKSIDEQLFAGMEIDSGKSCLTRVCVSCQNSRDVQVLIETGTEGKDLLENDRNELEEIFIRHGFNLLSFEIRA